MFNEPHDLFHDFPEYQDKIETLRNKDPQFQEIFNEYHRIESEVHRIVLEMETPADHYVEHLKKNRVHLKDRLYAMLQAGI